MASQNQPRFGQERHFRCVHQLVCIHTLDVQKELLLAFTELSLTPISDELKYVVLNCSAQIRVERVTIDDEDVPYTHRNLWDTTMHRSATPPGSGVDQSAAPSGSAVDVGGGTGAATESTAAPTNTTQYHCLRDLCARHSSIAARLDPDFGGGELRIEIPSPLRQQLVKQMRVFKTGLYFAHDSVVSDDDAEYTTSVSETNVYNENAQRHDSAHAPFSTAGCTRYWLPCVDAPDELCLWRIEVSVDERLTVVASGELTDLTRCDDEPKMVAERM